MSENNNFYVDTDGIGKYEPYMRELGTHLRAVGEVLDAALNALGPCWGDDQTGREFLAQYQPGATSIQDALRDMSKLYDSTSDGISTMSKQFDALERENTDAVGSHLRNQIDVPSGDTGRGSGSGHGVRS